MYVKCKIIWLSADTIEIFLPLYPLPVLMETPFGWLATMTNISLLTDNTLKQIISVIPNSLQV